MRELSIRETAEMVRDALRARWPMHSFAILFNEETDYHTPQVLVECKEELQEEVNEIIQRFAGTEFDNGIEIEARARGLKQWNPFVERLVKLDTGELVRSGATGITLTPALSVTLALIDEAQEEAGSPSVVFCSLQ